jgi:hypothetical protein
MGRSNPLTGLRAMSATHTRYARPHSRISVATERWLRKARRAEAGGPRAASAGGRLLRWICRLLGMYRLQGVRDEGLPAVLTHDGSRALVAVSGGLFLRPDSRYTLRLVLAEVEGERVRTLVRQVHGRWFDLGRGAVRLRTEEDLELDAVGGGWLEGDRRTLRVVIALTAPGGERVWPRSFYFSKP